jgi:hypothetical protein
LRTIDCREYEGPQVQRKFQVLLPYLKQEGALHLIVRILLLVIKKGQKGGQQVYTKNKWMERLGEVGYFYMYPT